MTPTEAGFNQALDINPDDWETRLIFADWLEEQNRSEEANLQRWLVRYKKHPRHHLVPEQWSWCRAKCAGKSKVNVLSKDMEDIYDKVNGGNGWGPDTREEAEYAMLKVLRWLKEIDSE